MSVHFLTCTVPFHPQNWCVPSPPPHHQFCYLVKVIDTVHRHVTNTEWASGSQVRPRMVVPQLHSTKALVYGKGGTSGSMVKCMWGTWGLWSAPQSILPILKCELSNWLKWYMMIKPLSHAKFLYSIFSDDYKLHDWGIIHERVGKKIEFLLVYQDT